jgi:hypothetical protein
MNSRIRAPTAPLYDSFPISTTSPTDFMLTRDRMAPTVTLQNGKLLETRSENSSVVLESTDNSLDDLYWENLCHAEGAEGK